MHLQAAPPGKGTRLESLANIVFLVTAVGVGGLVIWDRFQPPRTVSAAPTRADLPLPTELVSINGAPTRGDANAPVVLIEWSDFECPFCGKSATTLLPELDRLYIDPGKVRFVFKHLPLTRIHASAQRAAEAAECAGQQARFWAFHDWAFRNQKQLDEERLRLQAKTLALDLNRFTACLKNGGALERVKVDVSQAERYQIAGTPTWFVGVAQANETVKVSQRFNGAKPLAEIQQALEKALAAASNARIK